MSQDIQDMANQLLTFWFRHPYVTYFKHSQLYDHSIKYFFGRWYNRQDLHYLPWDQNRHTFLCYVLILDQLPRHIYRGTPQAYAFDRKAVQFVQKHGPKFYSQMNPTELLFATLPFQHSESLTDQKLGLKILQSFIQKSHPNSPILQDALHHQKAHRDVIQSFGRFPKRNQYLKRRSTKSELHYLEHADPSLPY